MVRSTLSLVRSQPKWVSAVTLTSNLPALVVMFCSAIGYAFKSGLAARYATTCVLHV